MEKVNESKKYYIYMIRCEDNSLYTGITTDLTRRLEEHIERGKKGAKYTLGHHAIKLETAWETTDKIKASKLEYHIKTLKKVQKEQLINNTKKLEDFLADKIEYKQYIKVNIEDKS